MKVKKEVKKIICDYYNVKVSNTANETHLISLAKNINDDADIYDIMGLLETIENKFGIQINNKVSIQTIQDVINCVYKTINGQ